jgi:pilus assembly protein Flp/PilA
MAELLGFIMGQPRAGLARPIDHMVQAGRGRLRRFPYAYPTPKKTDMCLLRNDCRKREISKPFAACTGRSVPPLNASQDYKIIPRYELKEGFIVVEKLRTLRRNQKGATAIEYGLIAALIAVAAIGAMTSLGTKLGSTFNNVKGNMR